LKNLTYPIKILTTDNEEAVIKIQSKIPTPSGKTGDKILSCSIERTTTPKEAPVYVTSVAYSSDGKSCVVRAHNTDSQGQEYKGTARCFSSN